MEWFTGPLGDSKPAELITDRMKGRLVTGSTLAGAHEKLRRMPAAVRLAVMNAAAKLEAFGDRLGAPHTSQAKGGRTGIRE